MTTEAPDFTRISLAAGAVFTPGSPINEGDLFAGRIPQIQKVTDVLSQRGYHAVLYGERGVGKTSLANRISAFFQDAGKGQFVVPRVNCDAADTYSTLWRKVFAGIVTTHERRGIGFSAEAEAVQRRVVEQLGENLTPDDVRRVLEQLSGRSTLLVIIDEFDRLVDRKVTVLMADTIKALSDYGVRASVLLIGVADSVDDLIEGHQSIERALVQIPMPRMSRDEIRQIIEGGMSRLHLIVDADAVERMVALSQGLPYIAHMLGLHSVRAALAENSTHVTRARSEEGIRRALDQWQQSTKNSYYDAVNSPQPGNIYKEVLLACALAEHDELGYFTAAAVRSPLRVITGRSYDIPNFARHLKEFSQDSRGGVLERVGEKRRLRYRFNSPLLRPYIVMRGFSEGLLDSDKMEAITDATHKKVEVRR